MGHAMSQRVGLAGARPRHDEQGTVAEGGGRPLLLVQLHRARSVHATNLTAPQFAICSDGVCITREAPEQGVAACELSAMTPRRYNRRS
jgi:hypothetical protein